MMFDFCVAILDHLLVLCDYDTPTLHHTNPTSTHHPTALDTRGNGTSPTRAVTTRKATATSIHRSSVSSIMTEASGDSNP